MPNKLKMLTVEDLVEFCKTNNFAQFSSAKSGYSLHVQVPCEYFEQVEGDDPLMLFANIRLMHTGINRNMSNLTEDAARKCMSKIAYKPILADFTDVNGERDFTYHAIEINEDGSRQYIERQVGCFTADKAYMEEDPDNKDRKYLYARAAIPYEYTDAAEIIERKGGTTKISVELAVNEMSYSVEDGLLLEDVDVMGATLLGVDPDTGEQVKEGMEKAMLQIEDFSADNNSIVNKSELIEAITAEVLHRLDYTNNNHGKEELVVAESETKNVEIIDEATEGEVTETPEVVEVYDGDDGQELDDQPIEETVETESVTEDDNQEPVLRTAADDEEEDGDEEEDVVIDDDEQEKKRDFEDDGNLKYSITVGDKVMEFSISLTEKLMALTELVNATYGEADCAYYEVDAYEEDKYVIMHDFWGNKHYRQSYTVSRNGAYSLKGDRVQCYARYLTQDEITRLDNMKADYAVATDKLQKYESEPEKMQILESADYANIAGQAEFAALKEPENHFDLSVDEVREKADAMLLAYAKSGVLNFSAENKEEKKEAKKDLFAFAKFDTKTDFLDRLLNEGK